jgi:PIN domain nuclease of toxin-antitoxin system
VILVDTHVLLWLDAGSLELGPRTRTLLDRALRGDGLAVSAISFWEAAMLAGKGRIRIGMELAVWRATLLGKGLRECPIDGLIGLHGAQLEGFHGDPADRLIVATALANDALLCTADRRILDWKSTLRRRNAAH